MVLKQILLLYRVILTLDICCRLVTTVFLVMDSPIYIVDSQDQDDEVTVLDSDDDDPVIVLCEHSNDAATCGFG
jgi:hypothetical protein